VLCLVRRGGTAVKVVVVRGRRETRKKNPAVANPPQINFPVGTGLEGVITPMREPSPSHPAAAGRR
jgi:hypothetical protein